MPTLLYVRPADLPANLGQTDLEVTTRREIQEGLGRTMRVYSIVMRRVSRKVEELIDLTPPEEPVQLAGWFTFETLSDALDLVYAGYLNVGADESEDVDDLLCVWRAQHKLYRVTAPQGQAPVNEL